MEETTTTIPDLNQVQELSSKALEMAIAYAPRVALALITLIIGIWIINKVVAGSRKLMEVRSVDATLRAFLGSMLNVVLKALLFISVASMVGIATTSFIAILGAAGLAIGLALQGSLANFAGGVLILLFKPFKVGDFIEAQGFMGTVKEIQIFVTFLNTVDNRLVIIPNGPLSNGSLVNFSAESLRRVDMKFGIGYGDDIRKAKAILEKLVSEDPRTLKDPAHQIALSELADSSVNFVVRVWVNAADYWGLYFDMHEKVKLTFDAEGISIPYPQRDVHVYQHNVA
jgi:small conductance mechanosensitive channel